MKSSHRKFNASDKIFGALAAIFGHKFISQYPNAAAERMARKFWDDGLAGMTEEQIRRGINFCVHNSENIFPPSLPEFRNWCMATEKELGIPDVEIAFHMAIRRNWAHPIIFHTVEQMGSYEFRTMSYEKSLKKFTEIYKKLTKSALRGEVFLLPDHIGKK